MNVRRTWRLRHNLSGATQDLKGRLGDEADNVQQKRLARYVVRNEVDALNVMEGNPSC